MSKTLSNLSKLGSYLLTHYIKRGIQDAKILFRGNGGVRVNFLICGAQKAGTSALDSYLRKHPSICMADFKEVHFFDREKYFIHPQVDYHHYHHFFSPRKNHLLLGESTPVYIYWYSAPRRIWEYNPDMKLIIILRNPIERAYSHWNMQRDRGREKLTFKEALEAEPVRRYATRPFQCRKFSYIDRGFYSRQISRLRSYFPEEQTLILRNRDLQEDHTRELQKITSFLGVDDYPNISSLTAHQRPYPEPIPEEDYRYLQDLFFHEIKQLEFLTGWNCQDWLRD